MNYSNFHRHESDQSDNQTISQTQTIQQPIVTLEYLLNQNKMKQIALRKATHLIQLYKIELQVKQQDYAKQLQDVGKQQKYQYESLVAQLQDKVVRLERQVKVYEQKVKQLQSRPLEVHEMHNLNESGCRVPRIARNNSKSQLQNARKATVRYSHSKNSSGLQSNPMKRSLSTFICTDVNKQQQLYRIQKSFLISYLLSNQQKDEKLVSLLYNELYSQLQQLKQKIPGTKSNDKIIEQFIKSHRQPLLEMQAKVKQYKQVIKIQQLIIQQLNQQIAEYQDVIHVTNVSLQEIYCKEQSDDRWSGYLKNSSYMSLSMESTHRSQQMFHQYSDMVDATQQSTISKIRHHKCFIKQKMANMEAQNKQLKRILDDMIKLIKNNKKLQMGNSPNARNSRTTEDFDAYKDKKSTAIYRK